MNSARFQRIWPLFLASAVTVGAGVAVALCRTNPPPIAMPAATLTFGIVVSGFVATQRNMFLTMSGAQVLRFAVRSKYHLDVLAYLRDCIRGGLLVTTISPVGFFLGKNEVLWWIWLPLMAGALTLAVCLVVRNEVLMNQVAALFLEEQNPADGSERV